MKALVQASLRRFPRLYDAARFVHRAGTPRAADVLLFQRLLRQVGAGRAEAALAVAKAWAEKQIELPQVFSEALYTIYDAALLQRRQRPSRSNDWDRYGIHQGIVEPTLLDEIVALLEAAPKDPGQPVVHGDVYYNSKPQAHHDAMRNGHRFCHFDAGQRILLAGLIERLALPIEQCLGRPGRLVAVKAWFTRPRPLETNIRDQGMNDWHRDGMPEEICKMMVYPLGASPELGTTEFRYEDGSTRNVEGPRGTYALIKNSTHWHRGRAALGRERSILEAPIAPAAMMDFRVPDTTVSVVYPKLPWADLPY